MSTTSTSILCGRTSSSIRALRSGSWPMQTSSDFLHRPGWRLGPATIPSLVVEAGDQLAEVRTRVAIRLIGMSLTMRPSFSPSKMVVPISKLLDFERVKKQIPWLGLGFGIDVVVIDVDVLRSQIQLRVHQVSARILWKGSPLDIKRRLWLW